MISGMPVGGAQRTKTNKNGFADPIEEAEKESSRVARSLKGDSALGPSCAPYGQLEGYTMKKFAIVAAGLASVVAAAPAAAQTTFLTITNNEPPVCLTSSAVCNFNVNGEVASNGNFTLISNDFGLPTAGFLTGQIGNSATTSPPFTNIDFTSVFLTNTATGAQIAFNLFNDNVFSDARLVTPIAIGNYRLTIQGFAQNPGTAFPIIAGDLTFQRQLAAIPEPSTWALFILGFGAIGFGMRRRNAQVRATKARLTYA
jgi:hypothetical protein